MADNKERFTNSLQNERDSLVKERAEFLRQMTALTQALEANASQIEAADTLILRHKPDHISIDVRTDLNGAPLVSYQRELGSSVSPEALTSQQTKPETTEVEQKADEGAAKAKPVKQAKAKTTTSKTPKTEKPKSAPKGKAKPVAAEASETATEEVVDERSPERKAISEYFHKSNRNETILKILRSKSEPVNASTITNDFKALYPLPIDSNEMKAIHAQRVSAALYYLQSRGDVARFADERGDGKPGENVRWEITRQGRGATPRKANKVYGSGKKAHFTPPSQPTEAGIGMTH